jgi:hypothetical protein
MMDESINRRKQDVGVKWIKGDSGRTYLCPVNKLEELKNPTEEDLKRICVDDSDNPQND